MRPHAIVLAAGAGRRFGGGKLLASYRGRPLIAWAVEAALASPVGGVTVVVAPEGQAVGDTATVVAARRSGSPPLRVIVAEEAAEGMGASIRTGVAAMPADPALIVFLADMPRVDAAIVPRLIDALDRGAAAAAPVFDGRRGHPVAFAPELRQALLLLSGDAGAREVLAGLGERLALIEAADDGVLFDVDRPEHLSARP